MRLPYFVFNVICSAVSENICIWKEVFASFFSEVSMYPTYTDGSLGISNVFAATIGDIGRFD